MRSFRDLVAWQKAMALATQVYRVSQSWPADERFGLISQVRRAAVSVPANIAEGQGRNSDGEFVQFLGIAYGSLSELETLVLIGTELGFLNEADSCSLLSNMAEVGRLINGLKRAIRESSTTSQRKSPKAREID